MTVNRTIPGPRKAWKCGFDEGFCVPSIHPSIVFTLGDIEELDCNPANKEPSTVMPSELLISLACMSLYVGLRRKSEHLRREPTDTVGEHTDTTC